MPRSEIVAHRQIGFGVASEGVSTTRLQIDALTAIPTVLKQ
jgi:hypothetical protein